MMQYILFENLIEKYHHLCNWIIIILIIEKNVSVQYHCNITCSIDSVAIDKGSNQRSIVYGDTSSIDWIENRGK